MIYNKQESDGYTKVTAGAAQLQSSKPTIGLGVIHSDAAPSADTSPDFIFHGVGPHETLGSADCYVKVLSITPIEFSATEI
jgi:hypothetical protein